MTYLYETPLTSSNKAPLPCPFCGKQATIDRSVYKTRDVRIKCQNPICNVTTGWWDVDSLETLVTNWNETARISEATQQALLKQQPRKVDTGTDPFECPSCGQMLEEGANTPAYCPACGQALDWSE